MTYDEPSSAHAPHVAAAAVQTVPSAKRLCLQGVALAVTGVFPQLDREEVCDIIKTYGGTVTGSVSGKTHYLLTGDALESGDPVSASAKYRAAKERGVPTLTLPAFLEFLASRPAQGECRCTPGMPRQPLHHHPPLPHRARPAPHQACAEAQHTKGAPGCGQGGWQHAHGETCPAPAWRRGGHVG